MLRGRVPRLDDDSSGVHRRSPAKEFSGGCKTVHFHHENTSRGDNRLILK